MTQEELWDSLYSKKALTWRGNTVIPVPNTGKALDLGCGNGKTVSTLIDDGYEVTGVDFSSVAIEQCRDRFKGSTFVTASVCNLPFDDSSFDYVTAVHVFEHLDDRDLASAVGEIKRVLRTGGYVFVRSFTEKDMRSEGRKGSDIFYRFYDTHVLEDAFSDFDIESLQTREERTRFGAIRSRVELLARIS